MEDQGNSTEFESPKWHYLSSGGLTTFVIGACLLFAAWLVLPEAPDFPDTGVGSGSSYSDSIGDYAAKVKLYLGLLWFGDRLLIGGFFMWLAGRVIDAFRHPRFY